MFLVCWFVQESESSSFGKYRYLVLDLLQKIFYTSDAARESFVELCEEEYVQKVSWPLRGVESRQSFCWFFISSSKCRQRLRQTEFRIMLDVPNFHKFTVLQSDLDASSNYVHQLLYVLNNPIASGLAQLTLR